MKLQMWVAIIILLVVVLGGCTPHFQCRADAYTQNSHAAQSQGILVNAIVTAISGPPKPHPPLDEMLAECEK